MVSRTAATETYRSRGGSTSEKELTVSLIEKIAFARGEAPMETAVRLHDHTDPEALDQLLEHAETAENAQWVFEFTIDELTVTVDSDGEVEIEP